MSHRRLVPVGVGVSGWGGVLRDHATNRPLSIKGKDNLRGLLFSSRLPGKTAKYEGLYLHGNPLQRRGSGMHHEGFANAADKTRATVVFIVGVVGSKLV